VAVIFSMNIQHNYPPKVLYHLTEYDYGEETRWAPKKFGNNRSPSEPIIPRICFSLFVPGCFISLGNIANHYKNWYLYSACAEYYKPSTLEVVDAEVAQEVWRLSPVTLHKKYRFSNNDRMRIKDLLYFSAGHPSAVKFQTSAKIKLEKLLKSIIND